MPAAYHFAADGPHFIFTDAASADRPPSRFEPSFFARAARRRRRIIRLAALRYAEYCLTPLGACRHAALSPPPMTRLYPPHYGALETPICAALTPPLDFDVMMRHPLILGEIAEA